MAVDQAVRDKVAERYPSLLWVVDEDPEIGALVAEAVEKEMSPEMFKARLEATAYWRNTSDARRAATAMERTNPGEATNRVNATKQKAIELSTQLGSAFDENTAGAVAWEAFRNGWSEKQLRSAIAARVQPASTATGMTDVRGLASQYFLNLSEDAVTDLTRKVFSGELDENGVKSWMAEQAASKFPALGDWIRKGVIPATHFSQHKQLISQYTDIPEGQIDLANDPTWQRIISNPVPDGPPRPMSIAEATSYIRSTKQFADSNTGKRETAAFRSNFESILGVRA